MNFNEIVEALKGFEGTEDFENYIGGHVTADRVSKFLETEDGKKFIQPTLDKYHNKGLENWKKGNEFKSLVDAKIKELYPEADPKDKRVAELEAQIAKMQAENVRKDLTNKALTFANEKGLPVELVDFFVGADEETTNKNMATFEKIYTGAVSKGIKDGLKGSNYTPPNGSDDGITDGVAAAFAKLNPGIKLT